MFQKRRIYRLPQRSRRTGESWTYDRKYIGLVSRRPTEIYASNACKFVLVSEHFLDLKSIDSRSRCLTYNKEVDNALRVVRRRYSCSFPWGRNVLKNDETGLVQALCATAFHLCCR